MNLLLKAALRLYKRILESRIDYARYDPKLSRRLDVIIALLES